MLKVCSLKYVGIECALWEIFWELWIHVFTVFCLIRRIYIRKPERPKNVNHISDPAFGKFQTIFEKWIYLCPPLYSAPWVKYCSEKDLVMNYDTHFFHWKQYINTKLKLLAGSENKKLKVSLKHVWSECIPLSQCFESFESSFSIYKRKPKWLT
jgi:hypothetical protein